MLRAADSIRENPLSATAKHRLRFAAEQKTTSAELFGVGRK